MSTKTKTRRTRGQLHLTKESTGIWYIRGTIKGKRLRESTGTSDAEAADAIRVKREAELLSERIHGKKVVSTFAECVVHYLNVKGGGSNRRYLPPLVKEFGDWKVKDITTSDVHAYIARAKPGVTGATKNVTVVNPIIAVLRCAAYAGLCDMPMLQRFEEDPKKVSGVEPSWVADFLARCDRPKLKAYVALITTTGCRGIDACRLKSSNIDWEKGTAYLPKTKNDDARTLEIGPIRDLMQSFQFDPDGTVFGFSRTDVANNEIAKACKRIGMEVATGHRIGRHAFAERLLNKGYTLAQVAAMGGWRDLNTVHKRYGHLEQSKVAEDVRNEASAVLRSGLRLVNGGKG